MQQQMQMNHLEPQSETMNRTNALNCYKKELLDFEQKCRNEFEQMLQEKCAGSNAIHQKYAKLNIKNSSPPPPQQSNYNQNVNMSQYQHTNNMARNQLRLNKHAVSGPMPQTNNPYQNNQHQNNMNAMGQQFGNVNINQMPYHMTPQQYTEYYYQQMNNIGNNNQNMYQQQNRNSYQQQHNDSNNNVYTNNNLYANSQQNANQNVLSPVSQTPANYNMAQNNSPRVVTSPHSITSPLS